MQKQKRLILIMSKNDIKNRLTTLVFIIVLILMGIMFNVIP